MLHLLLLHLVVMRLLLLLVVVVLLLVVLVVLVVVVLVVLVVLAAVAVGQIPTQDQDQCRTRRQVRSPRPQTRLITATVRSTHLPTPVVVTFQTGHRARGTTGLRTGRYQTLV